MAIMLVEALKKGIIKQGDYIEYYPDYQECILSEIETGYIETQVLKTQDFRYQFAGIIYGQLVLVADGVTKPILLNGWDGHKNGPEAIQKYIEKCYSSKEFEAKGVCLNQSVFEKLPKKISQKDYNYCLGSPCISYCSWYVTFGLGRVIRGHLCNHELYGLHGDGNSCGSGDFISDGFRPIVVLPSDIKINQNNELIKYKKYCKSPIKKVKIT